MASTMKDIAKFYLELTTALKDKRHEECPNCGKYWYGNEWMKQECNACFYPKHYPDFEEQYGEEPVNDNT